MAIIERRPPLPQHQEHVAPQPRNEQRLTSMTPVSEEEMQTEQQPKQLDRRSVLRGLAWGIGGAFVGGKSLLDAAKYVMDADKDATERDKYRREGSVHFVDKSSKDQFPFTTTLVFPGFNVDEIDVSGQVLAPDISRYGQVASVDYGNAEFNPDNIAENTIRFCRGNGIYKVNVMGLSMGGMVAMHVSSKLREARINVESAMFLSSPGAQADVIGSEENDVTMIELYNRMVDWDLASYGGQATRRIAEGQVNDLIRRRSPNKFHTIAASENELPNNIIMQQLGFIGSFSITPEMARNLSRVPTAYVRAPEGIADNTIDVISAAQRISLGLRAEEYKVYEQEGITHANVWEHPEVFGNIAIQFRKDFDLPLWPAA